MGKEKILDSRYIKKYKKKMIRSIQRLHPEWTSDQIGSIVDKMVLSDMTNPKVEMDNNYTGEHRDATLLGVMDWALEANPILAGNGTFYRNQHEAINPIAQMLDDMLISRKKIKKQMFMIEDQDSEEYADLDRGLIFENLAS